MDNFFKLKEIKKKLKKKDRTHDMYYSKILTT